MIAASFLALAFAGPLAAKEASENATDQEKAAATDKMDAKDAQKAKKKADGATTSASSNAATFATPATPSK